MATEPSPQPKPNVPWIDTDFRPSLVFRLYMPKLDAAVRGLVAMVSGQFTSTVPLLAVATPTNANAAAAGVAVGQLYCDTSDPAHIYIRTF